MFYTGFTSASLTFLKWLRKEVTNHISIKGHIVSIKGRNCFQLRYAKYESIILLRKLYYFKVNSYLTRKRLKIDAALGIIGQSL